MTRDSESDKRPIEQYDHKDKKRLNNPPVGLVTPETDRDSGRKTYFYDPHLDPQLQWAGKAEHTTFKIPTVSLHVHERIDPRTIIQAMRKYNGQLIEQASLFEWMEENPPLREAIEFYKHEHGWSNRLIAGDSLLVMNSLLEKEGMAGKVQMIYIDPPYGIEYGSNFQPFVNRRNVRDGRDEDLTQEPEQIRAFRDTWELGIHSYLTYLRDRLLLAQELLHESGSVFVQISDENLHHVREILDELFGSQNLVSIITFKKTTGLTGRLLTNVSDFVIWYAKDINLLKYRQLFLPKILGGAGATHYKKVMLKDGTTRPVKKEELQDRSELPKDARIYEPSPMVSQGNPFFEYEYRGRKFGGTYKTTTEGLDNLAAANRLEIMGNLLRYRRFLDDYPVYPLTNVWEDILGVQSRTDPKVYVVQTSTTAIQRCILMSTDPGDIVFDPTCGSGTTAYVAEKWGRRWITCDTSRVATAIAKQRLMTAVYYYYELLYPEEGVGSGFKYHAVPHITLKSIANNEPPAQEALYDQPYVDNSKVRVSGPFTLEAVPSPAVKPLTDAELDMPADTSVARSGETLRHSEWKDELSRTGIRGKGGQKIGFSRIETLSGTRWLHGEGETKEANPRRMVVSFGPEHAPFEQRQVVLAIEEAQKIVPRPKMVIFAAFQFDPEAARDIDETNWPGVTLLKVQMNADLLTEDLKKHRSSNESFWLMGQPDATVERLENGKLQVEILGFDYYNTRTGMVESGSVEEIAMWLLDTDYDGRSLFPRQVFFPMAGKSEGWARLARSLRAEIDEESIEAYRGSVSLPFELGENRRIAVKIVDDRGIESLKIIEVS